MNRGMKTVLSVVVITFAVAAGSAYAVGYGPGGGGCGMRGWGGGPAVNVSDADYKKFMDETAPLRKAITVDQAELDALMVGKDPDAKRVRDLTASIVDNKEKVAKIAQEAKISGPGAGFGCNGQMRCGGGGSGPGGRNR